MDKTERRQVLLHAARDVFATKGYHDAKVDDIVALARVAKGTFYNYFESRELIVKAVGDHVIDGLKDEIAAILRTVGDPADRISAIIRFCIRKASNDPVWGAFMVRMLPVAPLRDAIHKELIADLERGVARDQFQIGSVPAALDLIRGSTVMGMRTMVRESEPLGHAEHVAMLVLRGLGMSHQLAESAAHRAFETPGVAGTKSST